MFNRSNRRKTTVIHHRSHRDVSDVQHDAGSGLDADNEIENDPMEI